MEAVREAEDDDETIGFSTLPTGYFRKLSVSVQRELLVRHDFPAVQPGTFGTTRSDFFGTNFFNNKKCKTYFKYDLINVS